MGERRRQTSSVLSSAANKEPFSSSHGSQGCEGLMTA